MIIIYNMILTINNLLLLLSKNLDLKDYIHLIKDYNGVNKLLKNIEKKYLLL